jgi:RNA polymerase sigma-70 factor (ECF subfamily)
MSATPAALTSGHAPEDGCDPQPDRGLFDAELEDDEDAAIALGADADEAVQAVAASIRRLPAPDIGEQQLNAWIDAIVDRDERALTALYDATVSRVYGFVLRVVRRAWLAEEVVEETYFQVWRQAARFDADRGRALTWLLALARSRAIDAVRREARFRHDSLDDGSASEVQDPRPAVDDLLDAAREHADLHRALMLLNTQPRQLVALAFFKGLSHEEIASQTALPLGTVKSQIRRALLTLRQALGEGGLTVLAT